MNKTTSNLLYIIDGGKLITRDRVVLDSIDSIIFNTADGKISLSLKEIRKSNKYLLLETKQLIHRIEQLEKIIDKDKSTKLKKQKQYEVQTSEPAKEQQKKTNVFYNHLSSAEVAEIEQIIMDDHFVSKKDIESAYGSSSSVIHRIYNGDHSKTSQTYITYLMKKKSI